MLAQTGRLCATIWLAYRSVSTGLRGTYQGLASRTLVGIADQGSKRCESRSLRAVKKHDTRVERGRARCKVSAESERVELVHE